MRIISILQRFDISSFKLVAIISNLAFVLLSPLQANAHGDDNEAFSQRGVPGAPSPIVVNEEHKKTLSLATTKVERQVISDTLKATGEVQAAETQTFDVNPPVSGLVKAVYAKQGDTVSKGQTLAQVHSIEVASTLTQLLNELTKLTGEIARVQTRFNSDITLQSNQVQLTKSVLDREEGLLKEGISARKNYQEAKNAYESAQVKLSTLQKQLTQEVKLLEKQRGVIIESAKGQLKIMGIAESTVDASIETGEVTANLPIVAPVSGCISVRAISLGERVDPAKRVFSIVNLNPIWVMVDIFQEQIPKVKEGQKVTIETPSKQTLTGTISSVGSVVDASTKTLHVRIIVENPNHVLRPGMFVTAQISVGGGARSGLVVPESAVVYFQNRPYVFQLLDGKFNPVYIATGLTTDVGVEVAKGLKEGDTIVSSGAKQLSAQSLFNLGSPSSKDSADEDHEDHAKHEQESKQSTNAPANMLMGFFGGLATAFIAVCAWIAFAKVRGRQGDK